MLQHYPLICDLRYNKFTKADLMKKKCKKGLFQITTCSKI